MGEWQVVKSNRRKSGRTRHRRQGEMETALHNDDLPMDKLVKSLDGYRQTLIGSNCLRDLSRKLAHLIADPTRPVKKVRCFCFGLGSMCNTLCARVQTAFLHALLSSCELLDNGNVFFYDPIFTDTDMKVLKELFGANCVLTANTEGRLPCDELTMFYLPHSPLPLLNNLLYSNWSCQRLRNVILFGNRITEAGECIERARSCNERDNSIQFVSKACEFVEEYLPSWDSECCDGVQRMGLHFTGLSLQWFPSLLLPSFEHELWRIAGRQPPNYDDADIGELVPAS